MVLQIRTKGPLNVADSYKTYTNGCLGRAGVLKKAYMFATDPLAREPFMQRF
jgi:hypothetical protein